MKVFLCLSGMVLSAVLALAEETYTSVDQPNGAKSAETFPPGLIKFDDADLSQVLDTYRDLSQRTVVRSSALPAVKVSIRSQTALTRIEALQALDTVLAQNGIVMIPQGTKFVKAVARQLAAQETPPIVTLPPDQLPDCGTYITYIVVAKHQKPRDLAQGLQPFASMPNSILGIDHADLIVLRDFSSNVRRMLQVLERIDKPTPEDKLEKKKPAKAESKK